VQSVVSIFISTIKKPSQYLCVAASLVLLSACLPEEKEDKNPINSSGIEVDNASLALNGFWNGGFNQGDKLKLLIFNGDVYGLDEDEAFFGTVASSSATFNFDLLAYPLSHEDSVNNEYVADGIAVTYTIDDGRLFNYGQLEIAASFDTNNGLLGELNVINDASYSKNSSLSSLVGLWTTADYQLRIDGQGNYIIQDTTDSGCVSNGKINLIDSNNSLMALIITRKKCDDFNGSATGFAAINTDGELEFYSKMSSSLLFMTFMPPATAGIVETPEETTTEE